MLYILFYSLLLLLEKIRAALCVVFSWLFNFFCAVYKRLFGFFRAILMLLFGVIYIIFTLIGLLFDFLNPIIVWLFNFVERGWMFMFGVIEQMADPLKLPKMSDCLRFFEIGGFFGRVFRSQMYCFKRSFTFWVLDTFSDPDTGQKTGPVCGEPGYHPDLKKFEAIWLWRLDEGKPGWFPHRLVSPKERSNKPAENSLRITSIYSCLVFVGKLFVYMDYSRFVLVLPFVWFYRASKVIVWAFFNWVQMNIRVIFGWILELITPLYRRFVFLFEDYVFYNLLCVFFWIGWRIVIPCQMYFMDYLWPTCYDWVVLPCWNLIDRFYCWCLKKKKNIFDWLKMVIFRPVADLLYLSDDSKTVFVYPDPVRLHYLRLWITWLRRLWLFMCFAPIAYLLSSNPLFWEIFVPMILMLMVLSFSWVKAVWFVVSVVFLTILFVVIQIITAIFSGVIITLFAALNLSFLIFCWLIVFSISFLEPIFLIFCWLIVFSIAFLESIFLTFCWLAIFLISFLESIFLTFCWLVVFLIAFLEPIFLTFCWLVVFLTALLEPIFLSFCWLVAFSISFLESIFLSFCWLVVMLTIPLWSVSLGLFVVLQPIFLIFSVQTPMFVLSSIFYVIFQIARLFMFVFAVIAQSFSFWIFQIFERFFTTSMGLLTNNSLAFIYFYRFDLFNLPYRDHSQIVTVLTNPQHTSLGGDLFLWCLGLGAVLMTHIFWFFLLVLFFWVNSLHAVRFYTEVLNNLDYNTEIHDAALESDIDELEDLYLAAPAIVIFLYCFFDPFAAFLSSEFSCFIALFLIVIFFIFLYVSSLGFLLDLGVNFLITFRGLNKTKNVFVQMGYDALCLFGFVFRSAVQHVRLVLAYLSLRELIVDWQDLDFFYSFYENVSVYNFIFLPSWEIFGFFCYLSVQLCFYACILVHQVFTVCSQLSSFFFFFFYFLNMMYCTEIVDKDDLYFSVKTGDQPA